MKDIYRRALLSLSYVAILFSGCASKNASTPDISDLLDYKKIDKPIYEIPVKRLVEKIDVGENHDVGKYRTDFEFKGGYLSDIEKIGKIPVVVSDETAYAMLPEIDLRRKRLSEICDTIAEESRTYWTYENGVIRFFGEKMVIYKLPAITPTRMQSVYNIGGDKDSFDVDKVKEDLFDEIEKAISVITDGTYLSGRIERKVTSGENRERTVLDKSDSKNGSENRVSSEFHRGSETKKTDRNMVSDTGGRKKERRNDVENENGLKSDKYAKTRKKGKGDQSAIHVIPKIQPVVNDSTKLTKKEREVNEYNRVNQKGTEKNGGTTRRKETTASFSYEKAKEKGVERKSNRRVSEELLYNLVRNFNEKRRKYAVLKESGIVLVSVTRETEKQVDSLLRSIVKNALSNMVLLDVYILDVTDNRLRRFTSKFDSVILKNWGKATIDTAKGVIEYAYRNTQPSMNNLKISSVIGYLTGNEKSRILQQPKILTLPNVPSRLKATVDYPYLEPQQISVGGTNPQLSYNIKYVSDGIDMAIVANVMGDTVFLNLGMRINQYLGKETFQAGSLGTFELPLQSPRVLNTSFRVKPGDMVLIGGLSKMSRSDSGNSNFFIPTERKKETSKRSIVIVAVPKLIRFVERGK